jgi:hypothetical protein
MATDAEYLTSELEIAAWSASVQRSNVYADGVDSSRSTAKTFRRAVVDYIRVDLLPLYKKVKIAERVHCDNIDKLIRFAEVTGGSLLGKGGYKYGISQKLLNLTLKYYWCRDLCKEPPHCPVDRVVINKTACKGTKWTTIATRTEYLRIIERIRERADKEKLSIARWELKHYKRRW